jgi:tRNA threonylcarbamoyladenosine biosynthesis protein TsaB
MKLLALDTATEACSAALLIDDVVRSEYEVVDRRHNEIILPMVERLLALAETKLADLDAIAFGRGPGSFTGVRIATGITQGLAMGADKPVVPVSNLAAVAAGAIAKQDCDKVLVCMDARMDEVYCGAYERDGKYAVTLAGTEAVLPPSAVHEHVKNVVTADGWIGSGTGWRRYPNLNQGFEFELPDDEPDRLPHAADIVMLAKFLFARLEYVDPADALPVYLRDQVAHKKAK